MAQFSVDGRMTVKTLKEKFNEAFGVTLRVYVGNNAGRGARFADDAARLGAVADERESLKEVGAFDITDEMTIGDFEKAFQEKFDIAVQVANADNSKLLDNSVKLVEAKNA
ncbi:hypothetical protein [Hugenholtzia roseola]|uniref:hypothetical protein n=1 Tax=Hugenholtzia roseola TaxID=1002 RepID=UPI000410AEBF|nr:hypothetical protein [Hugenholtzia roseola]